MKILILASWYPNPWNPVNGVFVQEQAQALAAAGNRVCVLHVYSGISRFFSAKSTCQPENGVLVCRVKSFTTEKKMSINALTKTLVYVISTLKICRKFKPDIIHAHIAYPAGIAAIIIRKLLHLPCVITEHTGPLGISTTLMSPKARAALVRCAYNMSDLMVAVGKKQRKELQNHGITREIKILNNVVNTALFEPKPTHQKRGKTTHLLFVSAYLHPAKGLDILMSALSHILKTEPQSLCLSIVGNGPLLEKYQLLAREISIEENCIFYGGGLAREKVAQLMQECDFFVLSSLGESFSCVLIEAMACGKPVVATICGGPEYFVTPEVGLLVPPNDVEALEEGLRKMIKEYRSYDFAKIALYVEENFSYAAFSQKLMELYRSVLPPHISQ